MSGDGGEVNTFIDGEQVHLPEIDKKKLREKLKLMAETYRETSAANKQLGLNTTVVSALSLAALEIGSGALKSHGVDIDPVKPYAQALLFILGGTGVGLAVASAREKFQAAKADLLSKKL